MDGSNIPLVAETRIIANLDLIRWLAAIDSAPLLDWPCLTAFVETDSGYAMTSRSSTRQSG